MPPHMHSPVQLQTPVAVHDSNLYSKGVGNGGHHRSACSRQVGRRRIFVQTDNGNVLGIELDRADKVESVKKKVQAALCVPTEQSALVFGDHVLDKDLSEVRNDSPLLLTRGLHRSSSTPCLSPTARDLVKHRESSQPFEIVGGLKCGSCIKRLIRETVKAIEAGIQPHPAGGGLGGAYYFRNRRGENIAIVKPTDEEPFAPNNPKGFVGKALGQPGLKRSIRVGETGVREVAAFLLDHDHFAKVPATALVKAAHPIFNVNVENMMAFELGGSGPKAKIGSFQQFVQHDFDASEHGTSRFPVSAVHRIGILDIRILNTDRHAGNILVKKCAGEDSHKGATWARSALRVDDCVELIPIDHGLCLPETLEDPYFEWLHWPQASFPFSEEELLYIAKLEPVKDAEMLKKELPMLRESCLRILIICTLFLQRGAAAGLTLAEIGGMMSRELSGMDEEASQLENICLLAKLEMEQALLAGSGHYDDSSDEGGGLDENQFEFDETFEHDPDAWWDQKGGSYAGRTIRSPLGCSPFQSLFVSSPRGSPKHPSRIGIPPLLLHEMHPLEEEHDVPYSPIGMHLGALLENCPSPSTPEQQEQNQDAYPSASFNNGRGVYLSQFFGPSRCVSLNSHKHRCHKNVKNRGPLGMRGASAFEMSQKINEAGGALTTPLILSDMNEKSWSLFLDYFQEVLPPSFTKHKVENVRSLQRFGTSCQF